MLDHNESLSSERGMFSVSKTKISERKAELKQELSELEAIRKKREELNQLNQLERRRLEKKQHAVDVSQTMEKKEMERVERIRQENSRIGQIFEGLGFSKEGSKNIGEITTTLSRDKELGFFEKLKLFGKILQVLKTDVVKKVSGVFPYIGSVLKNVVNWFSDSWVGRVFGLSGASEETDVQTGSVNKTLKNTASVNDSIAQKNQEISLSGFAHLQVLKDEIASHESSMMKKYYTSVYDAYNRGKAGVCAPKEDIPISHLTLDQIIARQKEKGDRRLYAVGKYQLIPSTLLEAKKYLGISGDTVFTPKIQEKLADYIFFIKRKFLGAYLQGKDYIIKGGKKIKVTLDDAMNDLALEFSSVPDGNHVRTPEYGNGIGGMKRFEKIKKLLIAMRKEHSLQPVSKPDMSHLQKKEVLLQDYTSFTTPYIHFVYEKNVGEKEKVHVLQKQLALFHYPPTVFIGNEKFQDSKNVKQSIHILNELYRKKQKIPPVIFMDNENGTVQRVRKYLGNIGPKERHLQQLLNRYVPSAGLLHTGSPSIRSMEKLFEHFSGQPETMKKLIEDYAEVRLKNEASIGLNSVSLVLDEGSDIPHFANELEREAYRKSGDVINIRGFKSAVIRKMYAKALIKKASEQGMVVLLKHFPGHKGVPNPHTSSLSTKREMNEEMKTFLEVLDEAKKEGRKNVVVMLGHMKLAIPNTDWDSEGKPLFASSKLMKKLHADFPNVHFITDDIGGMDAITHKEDARETARKNEVFVLN